MRNVDSTRIGPSFPKCMGGSLNQFRVLHPLRSRDAQNGVFESIHGAQGACFVAPACRSYFAGCPVSWIGRRSFVGAPFSPCHPTRPFGRRQRLCFQTCFWLGSGPQKPAGQGDFGLTAPCVRPRAEILSKSRNSFTNSPALWSLCTRRNLLNFKIWV